MLEYESTITDAAEPHIRLYLRSKTYKKDRMVSTFVSSIVAVVAATITVKLLGSDIPYWGMALAVVLGAIVNLTSYKGSAKTRIRKALERDHGSLYPMNSQYIIRDGRLVTTGNGTEVTFALSDLTKVTEDRETLELLFDGKGICVLPLRAFLTDAQKTEFLQRIQSEQVAASDR